MPNLANPRPMSSFDPSKAALLHESLNDQVMAWDPERASDWRRTADHHPEGVHWGGYIFDAWGAALVPLPRPAAANGLAPEIDPSGRVVAWVNPRVMATLRAAVSSRS